MKNKTKKEIHARSNTRYVLLIIMKFYSGLVIRKHFVNIVVRNDFEIGLKCLFYVFSILRWYQPFWRLFNDKIYLP